MTTTFPESTETSSDRSSVQLATELLGGRRVLHRQVATAEDAHELVLRGIPAEAMAKLGVSQDLMNTRIPVQ